MNKQELFRYIPKHEHKVSIGGFSLRVIPKKFFVWYWFSSHAVFPEVTIVIQIPIDCKVYIKKNARSFLFNFVDQDGTFVELLLEDFIIFQLELIKSKILKKKDKLLGNTVLCVRLTKERELCVDVEYYDPSQLGGMNFLSSHEESLKLREHLMSNKGRAIAGLYEKIALESYRNSETRNFIESPK